VNYLAVLDNQWRAAIAAHEAGHTLSLEEHPNPSCSYPLVMGQGYFTGQAPCVFAPLPEEACTAWLVETYVTNTDNAPIPVPGQAPDTTLPASDTLLNGCDGDDDNDGWIDTLEPFGCHGFPGMSRLLVDTDGDRATDRAECDFGTDPTNPASKPPGVPAGDSDGDRIPDSIENLIGSNPFDSDTDDDGVGDGIEFKGYNSSLTSGNGDGDGCGDGREIGSVNNDLIVSGADIGLVAGAFGRSDMPVYDVNKDGTVTAADQGLVASLFGACP